MSAAVRGLRLSGSERDMLACWEVWECARSVAKHEEQVGQLTSRDLGGFARANVTRDEVRVDRDELGRVHCQVLAPRTNGEE